MAQVPNTSSAIITTEKLTGYLLDDSHARGGGKAAFFRLMGFSANEPEVMRDALLVHVGKHDVQKTLDTKYGTKYIVVGPLDCPNGRQPIVISVWIVETATSMPRLVSAYPA